jgi:SMC interacting uncharacterized protein involved in chromosome segregation
MNISIIKTGGLLLLVFLAGMFVRGEAARRADLRRELEEIKKQQAETMKQVSDDKTRYATQRKELLDQTLTLYKELDAILAAKSANNKQIKDLDNKIDAQADRIKVELRVLEDLINEGL